MSGSPAAQFVYAGATAWLAGGFCQSQVGPYTRPSQHDSRPHAYRASSFSAALWIVAIVAPMYVQKSVACP